MRGYAKDGITAAIREAGGEIYAITSEPQTMASEARQSWDLPFESVGDPHHEIADECRDRDLLDLIVATDTAMVERGTGGEAKHIRGHFQPGVLALTREGRILYRWRQVPDRQNLGGATCRPTAAHVHRAIQAAQTCPDPADAPYDETPETDSPATPFPLFVTIILANGNFLRPKTFDLERGRPDRTGPRIRNAIFKLVLFLAAWSVAFATLPTLVVTAALAGWIALIAPQVQRVRRGVQWVRS